MGSTRRQVLIRTASTALSGLAQRLLSFAQGVEAVHDIPSWVLRAFKESGTQFGDLLANIEKITNPRVPNSSATVPLSEKLTWQIIRFEEQSEALHNITAHLDRNFGYFHTQLSAVKIGQDDAPYYKSPWFQKCIDSVFPAQQARAIKGSGIKGLDTKEGFIKLLTADSKDRTEVMGKILKFFSSLIKTEIAALRSQLASALNLELKKFQKLDIKQLSQSFINQLDAISKCAVIEFYPEQEIFRISLKDQPSKEEKEFFETLKETLQIRQFCIPETYSEVEAVCINDDSAIYLPSENIYFLARDMHPYVTAEQYVPNSKPMHESRPYIYGIKAQHKSWAQQVWPDGNRPQNYIC